VLALALVALLGGSHPLLLPNASLLDESLIGTFSGHGRQLGNVAPAWLSPELKALSATVAFGLFSNPDGGVEPALQLIGRWWVPGSQGCLFREQGSDATSSERLKHRGLDGLEECLFSEKILATQWFRKTPTTGFALMPLLLLMKFPGRKFFVLGDASTMLNPLGLAQWLANFSPHEPWYLGGRLENVEQRARGSWDSPCGYAGLVLSGSFVAGAAVALARCMDVAPWDKAPGGAWVLDRCLGRLGLPLTPHGGFHQLDERDGVMLAHVLEDHPTGAFLGLSHRPWVFKPGSTGLDEAAFFAGMHHDPIAFLSLTVRPHALTVVVASVKRPRACDLPAPLAVCIVTPAWRHRHFPCPPRALPARRGAVGARQLHGGGLGRPLGARLAGPPR